VAEDIEEVVKFFLAQRRDIRVVICDYDFMNFIDSLANNRDAKEVWENWGKPTAEDLNRASVRLGLAKLAVARSLDRCEYVQNWGLMQYWFGYSPDIAPRAAPLPGAAPDYDPYPGGYVELPSPLEAFDSFGWGRYDPLHLSAQGYQLLAANCIRQYYAEWLVQPLPHFATAPAPYNGETGVSVDAVLSWRAGSEAVEHAVYFGTSDLTFRGNQSDTSFNPGPLEPATTYSWRVDEIGPDGTVVGEVWTFTTAGKLPLGCIESSGAPFPGSMLPLLAVGIILILSPSACFIRRRTRAASN
jgi:hypothetical protein